MGNPGLFPEVSLEQTLVRSAVASFVLCHLVNGVVDRVEVECLCHLSCVLCPPRMLSFKGRYLKIFSSSLSVASFICLIQLLAYSVSSRLSRFLAIFSVGIPFRFMVYFAVRG